MELNLHSRYVTFLSICGCFTGYFLVLQMITLIDASVALWIGLNFLFTVLALASAFFKSQYLRVFLVLVVAVLTTAHCIYHRDGLSVLSLPLLVVPYISALYAAFFSMK